MRQLQSSGRIGIGSCWVLEDIDRKKNPRVQCSRHPSVTAHVKTRKKGRGRPSDSARLDKACDGSNRSIRMTGGRLSTAVYARRLPADR